MSALLFGERSVYPRKIWVKRCGAYKGLCEKNITPLTREARHGKPHPVYDFLFDYYSFRSSQLKQWSPGFGVLLQEATPEEMPVLTDFEVTGGMISVRSFPEKRIDGLDWIISLMEAVSSRPAVHSCYGLHEWAMVYRTEQPRYSIPLRFSSERIQAVVDRQPLVCTHYDAFRFFTKAAAPKNRFQLNKDNRIQHDQPGCIHANMDLYKWAYKFYPWISSESIFEAFQLAVKARVLDMRASPYDLSDWGFMPVCIETDDGRNEYEQAQRELAAESVPVRKQLLQELTHLRKALTQSL